jgi:hypothetical protein
MIIKGKMKRGGFAYTQSSRCSGFQACFKISLDLLLAQQKLTWLETSMFFEGRGEMRDTGIAHHNGYF